MIALDYTNQGRRPSVAQIISEWKKAGYPNEFEVPYGETYEHFVRMPFCGMRWHDDGNGCRGVQREKVRAKLEEIDKAGDHQCLEAGAR